MRIYEVFVIPYCILPWFLCRKFVSSLAVGVLFRKGIADFFACAHIDTYDQNIVFVDTANHQVKFKAPRGQVIIAVLAIVKEGNSDGKSFNVSFFRPMSPFVETDKKIFVPYTQAGTVKLIASIKSATEA